MFRDEETISILHKHRTSEVWLDYDIKCFASWLKMRKEKF